MTLKGINISDDITKDDTKLSFKFSREIEYDFNENTDKYLMGYNEPVPVVSSLDSLRRRVEALVSDGYKLKVAATESTLVEVTKKSSDSVLKKVTLDVDHYIQTKSADSSDGGDGDGGGNGDSDPDVQDPNDENTDGTGDSGGSDGSSGTGGTGGDEENDTLDNTRDSTFGVI